MTKNIVHDYNGFKIEQDKSNGYVSLTSMAKAESRRVNDYLALPKTQEYIHALAGDLFLLPDNLVIRIKGRYGGTFAHPEIAIDFAQWVSVSFRVWANRTLTQVIQSSEVVSETKTQTVEERKIQYFLSQVAELARPWTMFFDDEFQRQAVRISGYEWQWKVMSRFLNEVVYDYLPPTIREELDRVNPCSGGNRPRRQHQHLADETQAIVKNHISIVQTLMQVSQSRLEFDRLMAAKFANIHQSTIWDIPKDQLNDIAGDLDRIFLK